MATDHNVTLPQNIKGIISNIRKGFRVIGRVKAKILSSDSSLHKVANITTTKEIKQPIEHSIHITGLFSSSIHNVT